MEVKDVNNCNGVIFKGSPDSSMTEDMEEYISCQKCKERIKRTSQDLLRHNEICSKSPSERLSKSSMLAKPSSPNQESKFTVGKIGD